MNGLIKRCGTAAQLWVQSLQVCLQGTHTKCSKRPHCVGMVLSVEVCNFFSDLSSHGVQEPVARVVHHLGQSPQGVGNVACCEGMCTGHCSTEVMSCPPRRIIARQSQGSLTCRCVPQQPQQCRRCECVLEQHAKKSAGVNFNQRC